MGELTLMTIQEVAQLLHYSVKTIYKKAAKGDIPSVPISRRKRNSSGAKIGVSRICWTTAQTFGRLNV